VGDLGQKGTGIFLQGGLDRQITFFVMAGRSTLIPPELRCNQFAPVLFDGCRVRMASARQVNYKSIKYPVRHSGLALTDF
jgi:hypothetical protein